MPGPGESDNACVPVCQELPQTHPDVKYTQRKPQLYPPGERRNQFCIEVASKGCTPVRLLRTDPLHWTHFLSIITSQQPMP
jgi:hypothetical protein